MSSAPTTGRYDAVASALAQLTNRQIASFQAVRRKLGDLAIIELFALNMPTSTRARTSREESLSVLKAEILAALAAHDRRLEAADIAIARTISVCGIEAAEEGVS